MPRVGVFVPVSVLFPDMKPDFATFCSLVRSLSRTDTLFWCARLNLLISNPANFNWVNTQEYGVHKFLDADQIKLLNHFAGAHGGADGVAVFLRAQLVELMRWTCLLAKDHAEDGNTFNDPTVRRRFLQAALIASDLWSNRVLVGKVATAENVLEARRDSLSALRNGIRSNAPAANLMQQLARGISIYGKAFQRAYPTAELEFVAASGLTLAQYLSCACAFAINFANVTRETVDRNSGGFLIEAAVSSLTPEMGDAMRRFLAHESQTADQLRAALWNGESGLSDLNGDEPFIEKPLRERPILTTPDGRAIILDPTFFGDKTMLGPLFAIAGAAVAAGRKSGPAFVAFGAAAEEYANGLLRRMYPSASPPIQDRLICNPHARFKNNDVEIADACLFDATEAVVFETKAVLLPESHANEDPNDAHLNDLHHKYGVSVGEKNKLVFKGAGQLGRWIGHLALGELNSAGNDWTRVDCVFPVLIVFDISLGAPGHAEFFVEEFSRALQPNETLSSGYMKKGTMTVAPLTVMTIEDLENLESSVQHFRLVDLLRDYTSTTRNGFRFSLHEFMCLPQKKYRFIDSKELADRALKVLNETAQHMFPGTTFPIS